jgi:hypothetical protein
MLAKTEWLLLHPGGKGRAVSLHGYSSHEIAATQFSAIAKRENGTAERK